MPPSAWSSRFSRRSWEGVGVFYVAGGRIKEWFDYTIRVTP